MKKMYKAMALVLCAVLLVAGSVVGTLAYLKAETGPITNTMSVGKVAITLNEAKVDEYGNKLDIDGEIWGEGRPLADRVMANTYKLIPGHTYVKDPIVTVKADSESCYLFVKVENGIKGIEDASNNIENQITTTYGWTKLEGVDNVYYKQIDADTAGAGIECQVFGEFTIADDANVTAEKKLVWDYLMDSDTTNDPKIEITAYAVQADGFEDEDGDGTAADEAWAAAEFS